MWFLAETAILKPRTSLEVMWVETIQIKCYGLQLLQSLWQPPPPSKKKHIPVWDLCKTSDSTFPIPCDNGSCMTIDPTKLWLFFCFFFCWNLSPCIGKHKLCDSNTAQKVPLKQDVFRRVAGLVIKQQPIAEWLDLQLKGKGAERSLFVSSVEASPCKGHPHRHRRLQGV